MDLVKIGFLVTATGLKDANKQVDDLLTRVDSIGTKGKKNAADFESSQKKIKDSTKGTASEVDKTTKALERQRLIGEYLGQGLDKTTASAIASFRQLGGTTAQVNSLMQSLASNKGLVQAQKDTVALARQQAAQAKAVQETVNQYERLSRTSLGGGILDSINRQNKGLQQLNNQYAEMEKSQKRQLSNAQGIYSQYEQTSRRSFGGGILDTVDRQSKALQNMSKYYAQMEADQEKDRVKRFTAEQNQYQRNMELLARQTSAQRAAQERVDRDAETARQRRFAAEQRYYQQQMELQRRAQQGDTSRVQAPSGGSQLFDQIKGIAAYAVLSAAIYGAMTATINLIGATIKLADEYTSTQQRLKLYIKDANTLAEVNNFLAKSAIQNNVGLKENAALYAKLAPAMQRIGANTAATNQVVDAFGKSLRIGGATVMEATSATIQFAQAMASGKLAGDEFRSISEASPRFLKAIADGSGIAAQKLKEMSSAGALTTEVIARALVKEYHNLSLESESLGYTLEQGTNALKTGFMSLVGEFNEGAGITKMLGSFMAGLGVSMIDSANSAKESGEAFSLWFTRNAERIEMFGEALKMALSTFIAFKTTAMVLSGWTALTTAIVAARSATVGMTASMIAFNLAARATGASVAFLSNTLKFFGGWTGLILTAASAILTYVGVNKMMGDSTEETTKSLEDQGETIQQVVDKYKTLTKMQQEKALLDARNQVQATTETYSDQKDALVGLVSRMRWFNEMTGQQSDVLDKLVTWYKTGKITLDQFNGAVLSQASLTQKSKDEVTVYGNKVKDAETAAKSATDKVTALTNATKGSGDAAAIAGDQFSKFLTDAKTQTDINKLALRYMSAFNLDQSKAVDLAKQDLALRTQGKYATLDHVKVQQLLLKSEQDIAAVTSARAEAERKNKKEKKDATRDLEKFNKQLLEISTYQKMLEQVTDLDVARIASQKEYIDIYKDNLSVAEKIAAIELDNKHAEARLEYSKSLKEQVTQLSNIAELTKAGADYETAKGLAAASFSNDAIGREAAEKAITNALLGQSYALSDQITEQETLNQYLREGMGIEEARFKVALSRIAKLSGGKNTFNEFGEQYEDSMKVLRVKKATEASEIKINSLVRESNILTKAIAMGYTAANVAVAKLSGATSGLIFSQAEMQQKQQEENDLLNERIKNQLSLNSLLSGESETLRDVKNTYLFITDEEAKRIEANRKLVALAEAYASKMTQQKTLPIGDFSNVNFDVFGDIGNPFKEALDGLNAFVSGNTKLTESLSLVAEQIESLKSQAFVEEMFGNTDVANALTKQIEGQVNLEKDLQKQKEETNDIAYGQGLKLAKAFFKEGSKGYKVVSALEMALQAKKIAFAIWEKKDTISMMALELKGMLSSTATFLSTTATKLAAQMGFNVAKGTEAVLTQGSGDPYTAFPRMAAMAAVVAALGVAIGSVSGGSSGSFESANTGTGTVFGDSAAQSASIANSIDLLSENSDLMLPLTSAMLRSLRNIESNIGGVTNLIVRQATGQGFNVTEGFTQNSIGSILEKATNTLFGGLDFLGIGKAVGSLLGGLFGSTTSIKGQGLFGGAQSLSDIMSGGFSLQEYIDVQTKKKTFGITTSTKNKTMFSAANKELENQFTLIFSGFYDSILTAANGLGANTDEVKTKLENAIINIGKIDLKGLNGEQIQERLEAVFGAAADSLAQQGFAGLDAFQRVGEGYYETLVRVASSVEQAAYYTDRLNVSAIKYTDIINKQGDVAAEIIRQSVLLVEGNKDIKGGFYDLVNTFEGTAEELSNFIFTLRDLKDQLVMTGKDADYLTSAMILGAGGLEGLSSGLDAYFEMLSPAEQAAELTRRLTNEFAIFGKELPADVKAFRNLVNGIDISTEAGQKLYGQIIALAPEFNDLQDALESANSETNALVQSLRDLAEQARAARGETEQPRNLAYLRNEFQKASELALMGDKEAAARLVSLGKDLMTMSKLYSVSGGDYAKDLAFIQGIATAVADMQEAGLGTSISPDLTPSTTTNTTPTLETTNSTMTTEMQTMREEFNAGLFAIAKYVQNLDSRTERWDDGDRAIVGIRQESDDAPLVVTVTP